jgi:hypothetical protein
MNFEKIKGYKLGDQIIDVRDLYRYNIYPVDRFLYEDVTAFENGYSIVSMSDFMGIIDKTGREVIPTIFEDVTIPIDDIVLVKDAVTKKWAIIDINLNPICNFKYSDILPLSCGLMAASNDELVCGYVDKHNNTIIPFEYDYVYSFHNDLAAVAKGDTFGLINKQNDVVIPFEYALLKKYSDGLIPAKSKNTGKWGYINIENKVVIPFTFNKACSFSEGRAVVMSKKQAYTIDIFGNKIDKLDISFDEDDEIIDNREHDKTINRVSDDLYGDNKKSNATKKLILFKKNRLYGLKNEEGEIILPAECEYISPFKNGFSSICKENRWAHIDTEGNIIGNGYREFDMKNKRIVTYTYMYHDGKNIKLLPNNPYFGIKENNSNKSYWFKDEKELDLFMKQKNYELSNGVKLVKTKGYN